MNDGPIARGATAALGPQPLNRLYMHSTHSIPDIRYLYSQDKVSVRITSLASRTAYAAQTWLYESFQWLGGALRQLVGINGIISRNRVI